MISKTSSSSYKMGPKNTFNKITSTIIRLLMPNEVNNWSGLETFPNNQ